VAVSTTLGYPRIGPRRELKQALEAHWAGELDAEGLERVADTLVASALRAQRDAGIDIVPVGDFSLYDHVLDAAVLVGAVPERFHWNPADGAVGLDTYFAMARGVQRRGIDAAALEMTKWFDTNYHYLVPEFTAGQRFQLAHDKPFRALAAAHQAEVGDRARVVLLGPVSFLLLGKARGSDLLPLRDHLEPVVAVYAEVVRRLAQQGAAWIQLDEPCFVQDQPPEALQALRRAYAVLAAVKGGSRLALATYFGHVGDAYRTLVELPVDAVALDFVRGPGHAEQLERQGWPRDKALIAGVVDGRNVWITDLRARLALLRRLAEAVGSERLQVAPSCSLLHVPIDASLEKGLDPEVRPWLAFAQQKLGEVVTLVRALDQGEAAVAEALAANDEALARRRGSPRLHDAAVARRLDALTPADFARRSPYPVRRQAQAQRLQLPLLPTTTIGSFPQTAEVRRLRQQWRRGDLDTAAYERALEDEIRRTITLQEDIGLDVLVHGEFERNDMVEYFGEQLDGFVFTRNGWVQSYGSRCVKPPILFGTVRRRGPMTVRWSTFAQGCTRKPVKGMLTGPVTILQWSFVRDDQGRDRTCWEIALAIRDEARDLEAAGLPVIQIDEPALREGLPLRHAEWDEYLRWATAAFRLAASGVRDDTQLHTHMCYGEFADIIDAISSLDADVISMENARSGAELLEVFRRHGYDKGIGPGVYDIHSPRVPPVEEMAGMLRAAAQVLDPGQLWVNPDCGLKTRGWTETLASLRHMVEAARRVRAELAAKG
jgi:5-methyltetrahydropteroyltriglutamate--homocysteine methyltransferase